MKGLADKPSYIIELLEGGVTLEDVIDGHICEQSLVSSEQCPLAFTLPKMRQMLICIFICWAVRCDLWS